jgi:hypothetical protein
VASLIAQYLQDSNRMFFCLDTDPVNASLCSFAALAATAVRLLDRDRLNVDALDEMLDWILSTDQSVVIDNGAASFLPLSRYLVENDIAGLLTAHDRTVVVHTIITGGPSMLETGKALAAICEQFPTHVQVIVWLNAFFGPVLTDAGAPFEETPLYRHNQHRIAGLVRLEALDPDTAGHTLGQMLARRLTFAEACASPDFRLAARRRLEQIKQPIWAQLAAVI